jgi:Rieske Fe-S protein
MDEQPASIDRRTVLRGAVVAGAAGIVGVGLAGCSSDDGGDGGDGGGGLESPVNVPVAEVPVGGGVIVGSGSVVVTQPEAGTFKAFSGVCTHQGCPVSSVGDGTITCNCHGSQFSVDDGSVTAGPARRALAELTVTLDGDQLVVS